VKLTQRSTDKVVKLANRVAPHADAIGGDIGGQITVTPTPDRPLTLAFEA